MNNQIKTVALLATLTGVFIFVGFFLAGPIGATIAFFLALAMNFFTYWYSDSIVLKMYAAKELTEKESPNIHSIVERLAEKAGIPKPRIFLAPINQPNAFATGRNPEHGVVCFTYGILNMLNKEELEGVTAHELSHIKNRDILIASIVATIAGAITLLGRIAFYLGFLFPGKDDNNVVGSMLSFLFLVIVTPLIAVLIQFAVSRSKEYLADSTAVQITGNPNGLAKALMKLDQTASLFPLQGDQSNKVTAHLFIVNPFEKGFIGNLFSTHPPMEKRIEKLKSMQA